MLLPKHRQNRKYITYRNAVWTGQSHGHRMQATKLLKYGRVVSEICERTDQQTN